MPVKSDIVVRVLMQQRAELIGYAWLVVGDPDVAEDVFQDVSVVAIRKCDEIQNAEHLVGWLHHAIRLQGLKALRQQAQSRQLLGPETLKVLEQVRASMPAQSDSDQLTALRSCIKSLHGTSREIIELRYGQNLKPATIAEKTGKNIQTIYKTITRAHTLLRDCVKTKLAGERGAP